VAGCCRDGDELLVSTKFGVLLDWLKYCWLIKKEFSLWRQCPAVNNTDVSPEADNHTETGRL